MNGNEPLDAVKGRSVVRRLYEYVLLFKGRIAAALGVLVLALGAQLAAPLVTKAIIDDHLLAIQFDWYEMEPDSVPEGMRFAVYRERAFVRSDWAGASARASKSADFARASESAKSAGSAGAANSGPADAASPEASVSPDSAAASDTVAPATVRIRQEGARFVLDSAAYGSVTLDAAEAAAFYRHDAQPVLLLVGLLVALTVAGAALTYAQSFMLQETAQRIVQRLRMDIFRHLQRLPVRYFDNTPVGQVVSRVANDTENIKELYISFMATFVVSGLHLVGVFVALLFLEWKLALLCMLIVPLFAAVIFVHLRVSRKYVQIIRARLAEMNAMLSEMIQVMPVIQAFRRERTAEREFNRLNEDRYRNQLIQFRIFALSGRNIVYFVGRALTAVIVWYFGSQSLSSAISFGVLYAFLDYLGRIYEPIVGIFDQMTNAQRAVVSAERVFALMDTEGVEVDGRSDVPKPEGRVSFDNVTFEYKPGEPVLRGISFEAKRGQTIALVGHTGSGKSSIMNLLLGFYEPTGGAISVDGVDIRSMSKQALRRHMGIVLQDPFLFTGDVRFNVTLYRGTDMDDAAVARALREVGAEPFVARLAGGMREPVTERGGTLSAGERQLISFARALAYDPSILILDEATSSIDSETETAIQHALNVLRHGRTTFIIAHRLSTVKDADCILVLHRGEIVERGTHAELMELRGRYYRMYLLQSHRSAAV